MRVRFVDPKTNTIVYPEPLEAPSNAVIPSLGTNAPLVGATTLNPLLAPATISWDVRLPFKTTAEHWTQAQRRRLWENATFPPMNMLEVQSQHLPWKIEIRPRTPNLFVSVYDVLSEIQTALLPEITPEEWVMFEREGKRLIVTTRDTRVQGYNSGRRQLDESYRHPRRIDSLGEFTQFAGLVLVPQRSPHSLDLNFKQQG